MNEQQLALLKSLLQQAMSLLETQVMGQPTPVQQPDMGAMMGGYAPTAMAMSPAPTAPPVEVTGQGANVGRIALWQSSATAATSFNGKLELYPNSGDPKRPDVTYKVFLRRNTDPSKGYQHSGELVALDAQGNIAQTVGKCRTVNNTTNANPNVVAVCYVELDNGYCLSGPLYRKGGQSPSGTNLPAVEGAMFYNAVQSQQPDQPQVMPAVPPSPMLAPVAQPVAPQGIQMPQMQVPQMPSPAEQQQFFTQMPQPPAQMQMPQGMPPQQQMAAPVAQGTNIASMTPQQLVQFAMQAAQQQGQSQGGM